MLLTGKNRIEDLEALNEDFEYHTVDDDEKWKIDLVKELIDVRHDELTVEGLDMDELQEILEYLCIS
jgi:hypothetical protein